MDDWRFRSQQSPRGGNDNTPTPMNTFTSPPRTATNATNSYSRQPSQSGSDMRSSLSRRFTTDSGRVPTLSTMTSPQRNGETPQGGAGGNRMQLLEQKKLEYERIRDQRRAFELQIAQLESAARREADELNKLEDELRRVGHQSEPTTPPEYRESHGFPGLFSRPSRYSMSGLTSPRGPFTRSQRSGSQLASPPSGVIGSRYSYDSGFGSQLPSRSVPGTRRNSDDEENDDQPRQEQPAHRPSNINNINRYSMPTGRSRNGAHEQDIDQTGTARFLFGNDDPILPRGDTPDEHFPTLVRRDGQMLSASSAALDLALSASPGPEPPSSRGWSSVNRHRPQQSLPTISASAVQQANEPLGLASRGSSLRSSVDLKYFPDIGDNSTGAMSSQQPSNNHGVTTPPRLQSSFSSNDVPTMKNSSGTTMPGGNANNHAQQHFHHHNASMGRIPAGAVTSRHTRDLSNDNSANSNRETGQQFPSISSALQASAAPFGPSATTTTSFNNSNAAVPPTTTAPMSNFTGFFPAQGYMVPNGMNVVSGAGGLNNANGMSGMAVPGIPQNNLNGMPNMNPMNGANGFNMGMLASGMQQMNLASAQGNAGYNSQGYNGYGNINFNGNSTPASTQQPQQPRDSQARVIQNRRQLDSEAMSRYQGMPGESFGGQIYELCKDQHGCRYLQKKLEERDPDVVHMIWLETNQHVVELMTDPFGNYLCQKLLEFCSDDERTALIQNASQDMVRIALNQHGTRALQRMIEFVGTPQQVQLIIEALRHRVVDLIQDLNGNHVIQKCLNKLVSIDAQFIFDAVGNHCIEVGTHRHGCCVLQRCIDHASGDQKLWLVQRITEHARVLVQDPFGNYVVQYIIDLNEPSFTEPLVAMFQGCIGQLSRHKFSSNVIEKCLRCAQPKSKDMIVEELLTPQEIERLLRDQFANYVIQTALEYSTPANKARLVDAIRPYLPQIRSTPYGRRIQGKIQAYDSRGSAANSGQITPADNTQGQIPLRQGNHGRALSNGFQPGPTSTNGAGTSNVYPNSSSLTVQSGSNAGGPGQQPAQFINAAPQQPQSNGSMVQPNFNGRYSNGVITAPSGDAPQWL